MKLKKLLESKKVTQSSLAKSLGVSPQLIGRWIRNECEPRIKVLPKIARFLGVSIEIIVDCFVQ